MTAQKPQFSEIIACQSVDEIKKLGKLTLIRLVIKSELKIRYEGRLSLVMKNSWKAALETAVFFRRLTKSSSQSESTQLYFVSEKARLVYALAILDGEHRARELEISEDLYHSKRLAREWYRKLAQKVHPDRNPHPQAALAASNLKDIYNEIVGE